MLLIELIFVEQIQFAKADSVNLKANVIERQSWNTINDFQITATATATGRVLGAQSERATPKIDNTKIINLLIKIYFWPYYLIKALVEK